jgi:hypothetical protein
MRLTVDCLMSTPYLFHCIFHKNIMHVSAARLVGKWWLSPGEGHPGGFKVRQYYWSRLIHTCTTCTHRNAFQRILRKSCTSLFGSICYGSLFVNYFLGLRKLPKSEIYERKIAEYPLVKYVHDASIYMNKWGFVYVGLYVSDFHSLVFYYEKCNELALTYLRISSCRNSLSFKLGRMSPLFSKKEAGRS